MRGLGGDAQSTWGIFPEFLRRNPIIDANFDVAFYNFQQLFLDDRSLDTAYARTSGPT
jgi:hypothetical protein